MSTAVTLLNGSSSQTQIRLSLDVDLLRRLDDLYAYYHKQWWCRRQMLYYFKWCHGFLNALALLVMAAGVVVRAMRENSFVVDGTISKNFLSKYTYVDSPTRPTKRP